MATSDNLTAERLRVLAPQLARKRVLIIDRHPAARNSLRMLLSTLGITSVHGAGNSAEVVRQVKANSFDIVLADYILDDGRDGQQLLEELREQHLLPLATVYMVITGERAYQNVVSLAELAPDDYLIKPFTADELSSRLLRAIYKKNFFAPVFSPLDKGAYADALTAAEILLRSPENFLMDILRIKGEILNVLGRYDEAQVVYQEVLAARVVPWARMGLAVAFRGRQQLPEAEALGTIIVEEFPEFLAAYDFLAGVHEEMGKLREAQETLQQAASISPNNAVRQRVVGEVAARNNDLEAAERAYGKVLERHRGSSSQDIEDYTNLSRVMLDRGHAAGARAIVQELRRDLRGNKQGELAALVIESLSAEKEGDSTKAKEALKKAVALHDQLQSDTGGKTLSTKLSVDFAHACIAGGEEERGQGLLRRLAGENHEDRGMIARIEGVFSRTGKAELGQALLAQVSREIVELNNQGVLAARSGDLETSVKMLVEAADKVPNLQFLINASKAIFTLLERKGWDEALGEQALGYLSLAQAKDPRSAKVISAREFYHRVVKKYGVEVRPLGLQRNSDS